MLVYFSFYFLSGNDPHFRGAGRVTRGWENTGGGKWPGAEASSGIAGEKKNYRTQVQLLQCIVYPCQQLNWLTDYCADSCLVDLTDANQSRRLWLLKRPTQDFLMFFCVADVDAEERVFDSLVKKLKRQFHKDLEDNFWLVNILSQKFGQDLEAEVWSRFWS